MQSYYYPVLKSLLYSSVRAIPALFLLVFYAVSISRAIPPGATEATTFRIETYSVEQGLSQSSVWSMTQDRQGFLWIGTAEGLNRYDGYSFQTFRHDPGDSSSISHNTVWSLCQDRQGILWVGTVAGVHRFDPLTRKFARLADNPKHKGTSLGEVTRGILEDHNGRLWISSSKGVAVFDPASDSLVEFSGDALPAPTGIPSYRVLLEDKGGSVWVANGESLFRYEQASGRFRRIPFGMRDEDVSVLRMIRDRKGIFWFATLFDGIWSFDPQKGIWKSYRHDPDDPTSLVDNRVRTLAEDEEGRIWVGTIFGGLCYLDRTSGKFHSVKPSGGGMKNARYEGVTVLLRDRSGLIWAGYDGAGLVKINPSRNKFQHLLLPPSDTKSSGDNFFKALTVDHRGDIWLGMYDQGLSVLNRKTGRVQRFRHDPAYRNGIASNTVFSLLESQTGNILIGTDKGLDEFERATGRFLHHDIGEFPTDDRPPRVVNAIFQDSSGTIWCGTGTHLLKADPAKGHFTKVLSCRDLFRMPITPAVTTIVPAGGGMLWLGTLGGGLLKVRPDGVVEQRFLHNPNDRNSLSHDAVKTILVDPEGILWIGTEEGLNRYDPAENRWRAYRTSDGLPNAFIYGLLMDEHRRLWISTNKGLSRMETGNPEHPRFRNYTTEDGLQSYEFNTSVYFKTPQGELFFGGVNGFNAFFPDSVHDDPFVPPAVLTGFKKFDVPFNFGTDISGLDAVTLEPGESVFSFEFATLEFTNPSRNQYAYKMEGFDKEWIYCGTRREARYTNLDPGEYLFRVKGSNSDGVWDSTGTSIRVIIVPPFWRTGWFIAVIGGLLIGTFGGIVRYLSTRNLRRQIAMMERERAIQDERQKTRERIARDLHDDLASTVGSAGFFLESVKRQIGGAPGQVNEFLDKTSSLLTEAEQSMSDIVWSVSPQHDTVESLLVRIRLMTADICRAAGKQYEVDTACDDPSRLLPGDVRRNFYLVFKEALTNATRHSGADQLRVNAHLTGGVLELSVGDNGTGLEAGKGRNTLSGHGLQNMKQRAAEIGAEFRVGSPTGGGTVISLTKRMTQAGH